MPGKNIVMATAVYCGERRQKRMVSRGEETWTTMHFIWSAVRRNKTNIYSHRDIGSQDYKKVAPIPASFDLELRHFPCCNYCYVTASWPYLLRESIVLLADEIVFNFFIRRKKFFQRSYFHLVIDFCSYFTGYDERERL